MKILLFKSYETDDKYKAILEEQGYEVKFKQLKTFDYLPNGIKIFTELFESKQLSKNISFVITSKRATVALDTALSKLTNTRIKEISNIKFKIFVVGEASKAAIECLEKKFCINFTTLGEKSGNAIKLAEYINNLSMKPIKIYFLCGSTRLKNFEIHIKIPVEILEVYKTIDITDFSDISLTDYDCYVFFSPSGVKQVFNNHNIIDLKCMKRIIALGPSTFSTLKSIISSKDINEVLCLQSLTPTPIEVFNAIKLISLKGISFHGSCHCKKIKFQVKVKRTVLKIWNCNCSDCILRKNLHIIFPLSAFKLLEGNIEEDCITYTWGTKAAKRPFCKICGILPFYTPRSNPNGIGITASCVNWKLPVENQPCLMKIKFEEVTFDGQNWEDFYDSSDIHKESID